MSDVTAILAAMEAGEAHAAEELLSIVYPELRRLAARHMAREPAGHTLQATALVHEAWLRLFGKPQRGFQGRGQFFAVAAEAMRHVLIDHARRKLSLKRGAGGMRIDLDQIEVAAQADPESLLLIDEALGELANEDPRAAELVKLRFFIGLTHNAAAEAMGISERSAKRYWTYARAWLFRHITARASS